MNKSMEEEMHEITVYGRDVVVRRRYWFGTFHRQTYEVCDCSMGEPYVPLAVFYTADEVWKYISAEGHRVRNGTGLLIEAVEEFRQFRMFDDLLKEVWTGCCKVN